VSTEQAIGIMQYGLCLRYNIHVWKCAETLLPYFGIIRKNVNSKVSHMCEIEVITLVAAKNTIFCDMKLYSLIEYNRTSPSLKLMYLGGR
jgi:hypothetical protein